MSITEEEYIEAFRDRYKYAGRMVRMGVSYSDVEDLMSDTFASLWAKRDLYTDQGKLPGYIFTLLKRRAIDQWKSARYRRNVLVGDVSIFEDFGPSIEDEYPADREASDFDLELLLDDVFGVDTRASLARSIVIGFYVEELSMRELAHIHGRSIQAIRQSLFRSRGAIRNWLKTREEVVEPAGQAF